MQRVPSEEMQTVLTENTSEHTGCRSTADRNFRPRQFAMEQRANGARCRDEEPIQNTFR